MPRWPTTAAQGGADTIRARLGEHLAGRQAPGRVKAKLFSFEVTHYPLSRERALLEEYRRKTWRLPEFNTAPSQAVAVRDGGAERPDPPARDSVARPTSTACAGASIRSAEERGTERPPAC